MVGKLPPMSVQPSSTAGRVYGRKSADQRQAERRRALLEAGLELFGTRAYVEVTVADLVREAGVNHRAFYESFSGRESLLRAVHDEVIAGRRIALDAGQTPREQAERLVRETFAYFAADVRRVRIQFEAVVGVSAEMEEHRRVTTRAIADGIAEVLGDAAGPDAETRRRATLAFIGTIGGLLTDWLWAGDSSIDALRDEVLRVLRGRFFHAPLDPGEADLGELAPRSG